MLTHAELKARALANPEVQAEYERLNREEFAILDEMLAARREAGFTQAQVAERMGTRPPLWRAWKARWPWANTHLRSTPCANTPMLWASASKSIWCLDRGLSWLQFSHE